MILIVLVCNVIITFEMFVKLGNPFLRVNKIQKRFESYKSNNQCQYHLDAVFSLLDCLNDKEEVVRHSVENSLLKIGDRHPDEILLIVAEYKKKNPKLTDVIISTILRYLGINIIF